MSSQEWDDLPWWEAVALIEGLEWEKILNGQKSDQNSVDIMEGAIPQGFGRR